MQQGGGTVPPLCFLLPSPKTPQKQISFRSPACFQRIYTWTGQERRTDAAETAPAGKGTGRKSKGRENAVSMYRAIIRYPLEDVEMRELYDNKEDARLDALISVTFRYMEAEERYKADPEMFKCAGEYVLHAKLAIREVVDEEEKPGKILPFPEKQ